MFYFAVSKVLVTAGVNDQEFQAKTEILDLSLAGNYECQDWPDYQFPVIDATIGFLGTKIVVCGGVNNDGGYIDASYLNDCYSINSKETELVTKMSHKRRVLPA